MEKTRSSYITLDNLEVYKLAREYSRIGWRIYETLGWQQRKIMGDQMIESVDSVGANIAEGYGRFHYLDKNKFYFNARGSLFESKHWVELLEERSMLVEGVASQMLHLYDQIQYKLNLLIKSQFSQKNTTV